jgi:hypothetical protein
MKKIVICLILLLIFCIITLGMYLKHDYKVILGCLFAGNILIANIYLFYRIKDIGGKL